MQICFLHSSSLSYLFACISALSDWPLIYAAPHSQASLETESYREMQWLPADFSLNTENSAPALPSSVSFSLYGNVHSTAYWFADVYFGLPEPQRQSLIVDTGSSVMGFPCSDCKEQCGKHIDEAYNDKKSTSFHPIACLPGCLLCAKESRGSEGNRQSRISETKGQCAYHIRYTEGSSLMGKWFEDKVWLNLNDTKPSIPLTASVPFGCHSEETHLFIDQDASGILGLEADSRYGPQPFVTSILTRLINPKTTESSTKPVKDLGFEKITETAATQPLFAMCFSQSGGVLTIGRSNAEYHLKSEKTSHVDADPVRQQGDKLNSDEDINKVTTNIVWAEVGSPSVISPSLEPLGLDLATPQDFSSLSIKARPQWPDLLQSSLENWDQQLQISVQTFDDGQGVVNYEPPWVAASAQIIQTSNLPHVQYAARNSIPQPTEPVIGIPGWRSTERAYEHAQRVQHLKRQQQRQRQQIRNSGPYSTRRQLSTGLGKTESETFGTAASSNAPRSSQQSKLMNKRNNRSLIDVSGRFYPISSREYQWTPMVTSLEEGGRFDSYLVFLEGWSIRGAASITGSTPESEYNISLPILNIPSTGAVPQPRNRHSSSSPGLLALVDSGTTLTYVPFLVYTSFWTSLLKNIAAARGLSDDYNNSADISSRGRGLAHEKNNSLILRVSGTSITSMQRRMSNWIQFLENETQDLEKVKDELKSNNNFYQRNLLDEEIIKKEINIINIRHLNLQSDLETAQTLLEEIRKLETTDFEKKLASNNFVPYLNESDLNLGAKFRNLEEENNNNNNLATKLNLSYKKNLIEKNILSSALPRRNLAPMSLSNIDEECWFLADAQKDFRYFPDLKLRLINNVEYIWRPDAYLYRKGKTKVYCLSVISKGEEGMNFISDLAEDIGGEQKVHMSLSDKKNELIRNLKYSITTSDDILSMPTSDLKRRLQTDQASAVLGSSFFINHDIIFHLGNWSLGIVESNCPITDLRGRRKT